MPGGSGSVCKLLFLPFLTMDKETIVALQRPQMQFLVDWPKEW
jgi:hypothetical protein